MKLNIALACDRPTQSGPLIQVLRMQIVKAWQVMIKHKCGHRSHILDRACLNRFKVSDSASEEWALRMCTSNKLPGGTGLDTKL